MPCSPWKIWKSPRNDGLTKTFYVTFFGEIGPVMLKALTFHLKKVNSVQLKSKQ